MARGLISITSVSGTGPYTLVLSGVGSSTLAVGDHIVASLNGSPSTDGAPYLVSVKTDNTHITVVDSLKPAGGTYGAPGAGDAQFYTPTTTFHLSQQADQGPLWAEALRRDNQILDTTLNSTDTRLDTIEGDPDIRIFATQTTLLATSLADGRVGYAQDTDRFWFRVNATWQEMLFLETADVDRLNDLIEVFSDGTSLSTGITKLNFSSELETEVDPDDDTMVNVSIDLLSDADPQTIIVDEAVDPGVSSEASRADHKHTIASAGLGTIQGVGTTASAGSSPSVALGDHRHALPFATVKAVLESSTDSVGMNSQRITSLATPTGPGDAANKSYVDDTNESVTWKTPCLVATTANITLAAPQTIDGVSVIAGNRVLVKSQTLEENNGIYVVAAGAWTRSLDADSTDTVKAGFAVLVTNGTVNGGTGWFLSTVAPITLGTTDLIFTQFTSLGQVVAGNGLAKSGATLNVVANLDGSLISDNTGIRVGVLSADVQHGTRGGGTQHSTATTGAAGFMSAADKTKLDGIAGGSAALTSDAPTNVDKSAAAVGVATTAARADHKHNIATATAGSITIGASAAEGSSTSLARADHVHSLAAPSDPIDVDKNAASAGVSSAAARADHKHNISTGAPSTTLSPATTNSEGASNSLARSAHTHAIATAVSAQNIGTSTPGTADTFSRGDHVHGLTFGPVQSALGAASGAIDVNSQQITGLADPTAPQHAASKGYVDATAAGIDWKASVRAATTANLTLSGEQTVDGVALVAGNRILVKDYAVGADRGIYVVAAGAWTRSLDANTSAEVTSGLAVFVEEGTVNADTGWVLTTNDPIVLGTTSLTFTQFTGLGSVTAGNGLTKTGSTIQVVANADGSILSNSDDVQVGVLATDAQHGVRGGGTQHSTATTSVAGFMSAADKVALNDRLPTTDEKAALVGTSGTPSASNLLVTNADARNTNARTPTTHAASHQHGGSDEIATATAGANAIPKAGGAGTLAIGFIPTGTSGSSVAIGNDARFPSSTEKAALAGSNGTPSVSNTYVTDSDPRNTNSRTPTSHAASHQHGGADEIATVTPGANAIPKAAGDGKIAVGFLPTGTTSSHVVIGNDARLPTTDEKAALVGSSGTPASGNVFVTNSDARNTNSRTPSGSAGGNLAGTYPNPDVVGLKELGGTSLPLGNIADGEYVRRVGGSLVGAGTTIANHGSTHLSSGSDPIPLATDLESGLLSAIHHQALAGTEGTPSSANKYVTETDLRMKRFIDVVVDCGADPTGATDSLAAFDLAVSMIPDNEATAILIPPGLFTFSDEWVIDQSCHIIGSGQQPNVGGTTLQFPPGKGCHGIRVAHPGGVHSVLENFTVTSVYGAPAWAALTTNYTAGITAVRPTNAAYNGFMYIVQSGTHTGVTEPTWPTTIGATVTETGVGNPVTWECCYVSGILLQTKCALRDISVSAFAGDGFSVFASIGDAPPTNANSFSMRDCIAALNYRWGFYTQGGDANSGKFDNCVSYVNGITTSPVPTGGFCDNSFLGNKYDMCTAEGNYGGEGAGNNEGFGFYIPPASDSNSSLFDGCYCEGGQIIRINNKARWDGDARGAVPYGDAQIISPYRINTLYVLNDTNDDGTGTQAYTKIGNVLDLHFMEFAYGPDGLKRQILQPDLMNGAGRTGVLGWNYYSAGGTKSPFATTLDTETTYGGGRMWLPRDFIIGAPTTESVIGTAHSFPGKTNYFHSGGNLPGDYPYGMFLKEYAPQLNGGFFGYLNLQTGATGTWAPVAKARYARATASSITLNNWDWMVAVTDTTSVRTITLPTMSTEDMDTIEFTIHDESGAAGAPNAIRIAPPGAELLNGVNTYKEIKVPYGSMTIIRRNGKWLTKDYVEPFTGRVAVTTQSTSTTITRANVPTVIINTGATSKATYTLPATSVVGDTFEFYVDDADGIRVSAQGSDTIRYEGTVTAAAGYIESVAEGSFLTLRYIAANKWIVSNVVGPWSTGP